MKLKITSIILFITLFIGAFVYFKFGIDKVVGAKSNSTSFKYDQWLTQQSQEEDTRVIFKKDIAMVYITEFNTGALRYLGYTQLMKPIISLNEDTKAVYLYDEKLAPNSDTGLMVIHDAYSWDTLLNEQVFSTNSQTDIQFNTFADDAYPHDKQPVINEERLFLDVNLHIQTVDNQGTILVRLDDKEYRIQSGETAEIGHRQGRSGVESTLTVSNLGLWDSHNMKYVTSPSQ